MTRTKKGRKRHKKRHVYNSKTIRQEPPVRARATSRHTDLFSVGLEAAAEQGTGQPAGGVGLLRQQRRPGQQTAQTAAHQQTTGLLRVTQPLPLV